MRFIKKVIPLLVSLALLTSALTGCGSKAANKKADSSKGSEKSQAADNNKVNDKNKTDVVFWLLDFGAARTKYILKAADKFNKTNDKGFNVKTQLVPPGAYGLTTYDEKLLPAIAAGTPPDIITTGAPTYDIIQKGLLEDITSIVEKDKNFSMDQFYPQKKEECYYDGKLYSMPFQLDINGFFIWNQDMFKKAGLDPNVPPTTIQQLDTMAEKMFTVNDQGLYDTVGFNPFSWLSSFNYERFFTTTGYVNEDGTPNIFNDRMVETYQWIDKYVKKYGFDKLSKSDGGIDKGKTAMEYVWIENLNGLMKTQASFNWNIAPFPKAHEDAEPMWLGGYFLSVCTGAKQPEGAVEFMKYFTGVKGQSIVLQGNLDEYKTLTATSPNKVAMEKFVSKMPEKYGFLITNILPQMIVSKKVMKPNLYGGVMGPVRDGIQKQTGEVKALLTDAQKKAEAAYKDWLANKDKPADEKK